MVRIIRQNFFSPPGIKGRMSGLRPRDRKASRAGTTVAVQRSAHQSL